MIVYEIDGAVYINLTNKCSNNCSFCVRTTSDRYAEYDLWLKKEPTAKEVIEELAKHDEGREYVFCGYGEPLCAFDVLLEVAEYLKGKGKTVRLNTNGQASLIVGEGVAERLKGKVDEVSISLNAAEAKEYNDICRCVYGEDGYYSMLRFAADCKESGIKVKFSVVKTPGFDVEAAKKIADGMGIPLRVRELIK